MKKTRINSLSFLVSKKGGYIDYENNKKVVSFNYKYKDVEEKQVALEILELYIHQNCSVIYSIIDDRFKKIYNNQAFKLLESVQVSNNLIC